MLQDAADVEFGFVDELIDTQGFIGMNRNLMKQYIKYVIDRLAIKLGVSQVYNVENPFPFMANLSLHGKTNFFEKRVTEYAKVNVSSDSLSTLDDF
jgi:ribonucleoside-diphosphate reductase subunit M2